MLEEETAALPLGRSASLMIVGSVILGGLDIACRGSYVPLGRVVLVDDDGTVLILLLLPAVFGEVGAAAELLCSNAAILDLISCGASSLSSLESILLVVVRYCRSYERLRVRHRQTERV